MPTTLKTRFAPSPTGHIHLGNARTALFCALLARRDGGVFLLRIEDTDAERSRAEYTEALMEDLRWLGTPWQEGPYFQSGRDTVYRQYYDALVAQGLAYPCFCTPAQLEISRKAQRAAGRPPRYSGKCAHLSAAEVEARRAVGEQPTLRFRVPAGRTVEFDDLVRGPQRFAAEEIGDFIIRRADGSPAFFFCNAIDDALMGISHVLRGEDHLSNTPRQILLLEALGLPVPAYGHITLIVAADGAPLSKRHGSRSLRELREQGYFPQAVANYLARLGHKYEADDLLDLDALAAGFDLTRLGRAPARYDAEQLLFRQQQAVQRQDDAALWQWLGKAVAALVPAAHRAEFLAAVRPNLLFPHDGLLWARRLFVDPLEPTAAAQAAMDEAGAEFFAAAAASIDAHPSDFKAFANAVKERTGAKGKALFMPLRAALTGDTAGPEMGRVLPLIGHGRAKERLTVAR